MGQVCQDSDIPQSKVTGVSVIEPVTQQDSYITMISPGKRNLIEKYFSQFSGPGSHTVIKILIA